MTSSVAVVGCGWLGLTLAKRLLSSGWEVNGSKTTPEGAAALRSDGIHGFPLKLDPVGNIPEDLFEVDYAIINIPPSRRPDVESYHLTQMNHLLSAVKASRVKQVILVSSTSVYPELGRVVTEEDVAPPTKPSGRVLREVEAAWLAEPAFQCTVLRLAGLIGADRKPGRFLSGRRSLKNGDAPVNLIARKDVHNIIEAFLAKGCPNDIFNACADDHPLRRDYYRMASEKAGLPEPQFEPASETLAYKVVSAEKLKSYLGYQFEVSSPYDIL